MSRRAPQWTLPAKSVRSVSSNLNSANNDKICCRSTEEILISCTCRQIYIYTAIYTDIHRYTQIYNDIYWYLSVCYISRCFLAIKLLFSQARKNSWLSNAINFECASNDSNRFIWHAARIACVFAKYLLNRILIAPCYICRWDVGGCVWGGFVWVCEELKSFFWTARKSASHAHKSNQCMILKL